MSTFVGFAATTGTDSRWVCCSSGQSIRETATARRFLLTSSGSSPPDDVYLAKRAARRREAIELRPRVAFCGPSVRHPRPYIVSGGDPMTRTIASLALLLAGLIPA